MFYSGKPEVRGQDIIPKRSQAGSEDMLSLDQTHSFNLQQHRRNSHLTSRQAMPGRIIKHRKHRSQPTNIIPDKDLSFHASRPATIRASCRNDISGFTQGGVNTANASRIDEHPSEDTDARANMDRLNQVDMQSFGIQNHRSSRPKTPVASNVNDFLPLTPGSPHSILFQKIGAVSSQVPDSILMTPSSSIHRSTRPPLIQTTNQAQNFSSKVQREQYASHTRRHSVDTAPIRYSQDDFLTAQSGLPSPPNTAPLLPISSFDIAPMPHPNYGNLAAFVRSPSEFDSDSYCSAESAMGDSSSSTYSSPKMKDLEFDIEQDMDIYQASMEQFDQNFEINTDSPANFTRSDNLPCLAPAPKSKTSGNGITSRETRVPGGYVKASGISHEEISAFISGPEASDGKWICLYPDCNKRFGRKENIKSHVQTHLGDRQFRCEVCRKCFVRQHDLKRHAKIHTGVKPYPCRCGNSFARHDALTRHRQRGMCIGAFEGIIKKVVKRGRPKKIRRTSEQEGQTGNRKATKYGSEYDASIPSTSPPALDGEGILEISMSPELPSSPVSTKSDAGQQGLFVDGPSSAFEISYEESSELSIKDDDPIFSGKIHNSKYGTLSGLTECTPPSSPPHLFAEPLIELPSSTHSPEMRPHEKNVSFTPLGSPTYEVIHRKLASVYNTPEWAGPPMTGETTEVLDLGDILGLSEFVSDSTSIAFDTTSTNEATSWRKNGALDLGMGLDLSMGIDMGEDAFDFIKPELLQEETLDFFASKP